MLTWPHSGCHVHTAVWVSEDDRACATLLARYCARNAAALEPMPHDRTSKAVTSRANKFDGPTAGTETADPVEFLARVLVHMPNKCPACAPATYFRHADQHPIEFPVPTTERPARESSCCATTAAG